MLLHIAPNGEVRFHVAPPPTDHAIVQLLVTIRRRVLRHLARYAPAGESATAKRDLHRCELEADDARVAVAISVCADVGTTRVTDHDPARERLPPGADRHLVSAAVAALEHV